MGQNKVDGRVEYIMGDVDDLKEKMGSQKFDIILAPELVHTKAEYFERIHDLLDAALADNGLM